MIERFIRSILDSQETKIQDGKMSLEEAAKELMSLAELTEEDLWKTALMKPYGRWRSVVLLYWLILTRPAAHAEEITRVLHVPNCQLHFALLHYGAEVKDWMLVQRLVLNVDEALRTEAMDTISRGQGQ